jgi:hypothetical protein
MPGVPKGCFENRPLLSFAGYSPTHPFGFRRCPGPAFPMHGTPVVPRGEPSPYGSLDLEKYRHPSFGLVVDMNSTASVVA